MKLIYLSKYPESVFQSQVVSLLNEICVQSPHIEIVLMLGTKSGTFPENVYDTLGLNPKIKVLAFKLFPALPFVSEGSVWQMKKILKRIHIDSETIFHVREEVLAVFLWKALSGLHGKTICRNILVDVRAAKLEELQEFYQGNPLFKPLKIFRQKQILKSLNKFSHFSVVSRELKKYIEPYILKANVQIVPCLADPRFMFNPETREKARQELGIRDDERVLLFSSGGASGWQRSKEIIESVKDLPVKIINLSRSVFDYPNVINRFVSFEEMPYYLNAADFALLWRDYSVVNKVASPVKFSEYIASGLPVVANGSVDFVEDVIQRLGKGKILEDFANLDIMAEKPLSNEERKAYSQKAYELVGVEQGGRKYDEVYRLVSGK